MIDANGLSRGLAALHAEAFETSWTAEAFAGLLTQPGMVLESEPGGFILVRTAGDESEILTVAVRPEARRRGIASRLVAAAAARSAGMGAERLLLEVAEDNAAALAVYSRLGFETIGRRPRYYSRPGGVTVDALLLVLNLVSRLPTG